MDLNLLYSQHQREIIRARSATNRLARTKHYAAAGAYANRIHNYQLSLGAVAAASWLGASLASPSSDGSGVVLAT